MTIAVAIALVALTFASFLNSLGLILMKMAILKNEGSPEAKVLMKPHYLGGLGCLILGALILVGKNTLNQFTIMNPLNNSLND